MLHLLQLLLCPAYVLRKKFAIPATAAGILFLVHYNVFHGDTQPYVGVHLRAAFANLAVAVLAAAIDVASIAWLKHWWQIRKDLEGRVWAPQGDPHFPRCPFSGEAITHKCPRCGTLLNQMCVMEELTRAWLPMVKMASPEHFLAALDPAIPGMKGRMLLDEAMGSVVDWMQCKASMCCLACALELRCSKVVPSMVASMACVSLCAALVPFALSDLLSQDSWKAIGSLAVGITILLAMSGPLMLLHAYSTVTVFTDLHSSISWTQAALKQPSQLHKWFAGPEHLTQVPVADDTEDEDADD